MSDPVHGPGAPYHKERFKDVLAAELDLALISKSKEIEDAIIQHGDTRLRVIKWQTLAAAHVLLGRDLFVVTATGTGKSFCWQSALIAHDGIVLVVCPLISLMQDQVAGSARLGLRAAAVYADALLKNPELITDICNGIYSVVFVAPELCVPGNKDWIRITADSIFRSKLMVVVIDEAHLVHSWRDFRPKIDGLSRFRAWFRVPFLVLSASMTPYVRKYVHTSLRLPGEVPLIHRSIDRPEIYLARRIIQHPVDTHKDLFFLIPSSARSPDDLIPTIVFTDSRSEASDMCTQFWDRVPHSWFVENPLTFADLSTALSQERRETVIRAMRAGLVKVLFATQVAEVGLDFQTVRRVVQWRIPTTLSAAALWQRWGRACRSLGSIGVGIIFGTSTVKIPDKRDHELYELRSSPRDSALRRVLQIIQDFDVGTKRSSSIKTAPLRENLEHINLGGSRPVFQRDPVRHTKNQQNKRTRLSSTVVLLGDLESDQDDSETSDYEDEVSVDVVSDGSEIDVESLDTPVLDDPHEGDHGEGSGDQSDLSSESGDNMVLDAPMYDDASDPSKGETRHGFAKIPAICRMILWIMNTSGCIRECYMRYLDEANFTPTLWESPKPCCDRCTIFEEVDPTIARMLPEYAETSMSLPENHNSGTPEDSGEDEEHDTSARHQNQLGKFRVSSTQSAAIATALRKLRREIWREMGFVGFWSPYTSSHLLSEDDIITLCKKAGGESGILSGAPLLTVLKIQGSRGHILNDHAPRILSVMQDAWKSVPASPPKPRGAPLKERPNFVPLFDINPAADPNDEGVIRLRQINLEAKIRFEAEQDRLQAQRERTRTKRERDSQIPASQVTDSGTLGIEASQTASQTASQAPTIKYDDETLYDKSVLTMVGRRPRGRPSKAKVEKRRADLAAAQAEFENSQR